MLAIHKATIYTPTRTIEDGVLLAKDGRILEVGPANEVALPTSGRRIDASGLLLVPGFIDLQLNGGFGHDFTADPASIWPVAAQLSQYGITAFLPTIITAPLETTAKAQAVLAEGPPDRFQGAPPLGLHIEGPFLNPAKKGAHDETHLRQPSLDDVADWSVQSGIRLVTLAPELPGALAVASALAKRGVVVSAGHSLATFAEAQAGFQAGIRYATHLFNAMPTLHHREPGLVGAALANRAITIGLIPDGVHVHPDLIKLIWALTGPQRLTLVTDAMAALGMPPGRFQLGEFAVTVDEVSARLADGTLAGSIITPDAMLRNLIAFTGCALTEALATMTSTPADLLSLEQKGRLAVNCDADLVLLTPDLRVAMTMVGGDVVHKNPHYSARAIDI